MDLKRIKIISHEKDLHLQKRIENLSVKYKVRVETTFSFKEFAETINIGKYTVLILTNETVEENSKKLFGLLQTISQKSPKIQILLFVKEKNIAIAVEAFKAGTFQYVKLPVRDEELKLVIETAIERQPQIVEEELVSTRGKVRFGDIIGSSASMLEVYDHISQAAQTDIPVLILGETGTGKDLVASTIHKMSARAGQPYLAVNLGALPSELVGSELFGHEKGAFTGAVQQHNGVFEQGDKGTVFLDEIDTMDEKVQVSLLRLLEQKKFKRLGGTHNINSKARLVAATNENIDNLVESGAFRNDLFYRLDVFRIALPPLRERKSDIPLLVDEMLLKYSKTYKKSISSISPDAIEALLSFDWPGNVRELKNVIQRAVIFCNEEELQVEHLPPRFHNQVYETKSISIPLGMSLDNVEREMVLHALAATNNNRTEAAKLLGISRRALYNKLNKHNL